MKNQYVRDVPIQGALYHRLATMVASNYSGLGPNNVAQHVYAPMIGTAFQKPLSGSTTGITTVGVLPHR